MTDPWINSLIKQALKEDIGPQDITTEFLIDRHQTSRGVILLKEDAVICGLELAQRVFGQLDKNLIFDSLCRDGQFKPKGTKIADLSGRTRAILSAERVVLNFLSRLSGIATLTRAFVKAIKPFQAQIFDTRKTIPGLRRLEKFAVATGGGRNHRLTLSDMFMIKDNHWVAGQPARIPDLIQKMKNTSAKPICVEVTTLRQLAFVSKVNPEIILLDNMNLRTIKRAVGLIKRLPKTQRPHLEVSGGVTLKNVRAIAATGIDRISVGALTHDAPWVDYSLEILP